MLRATVCALVLAACAPVAQAGELDRESPRAATTAAVATTVAPGGSEMDDESPLAAHGWRWGRRYYGGWGWGGFYPAPVSYFGVGFGPSFYSPVGFYGGYYNVGYYRPFFPAYYPYYYGPVGYGWWW